MTGGGGGERGGRGEEAKSVFVFAYYWIRVCLSRSSQNVDCGNCCCFCLRKNTPFIQVDILKKGRCAI